MVKANTLSDLILIVGQYDLYFMVQWFFYVFLLLFYGFITDGLFLWADTMNDILVEGQCNLCFMVQ